MESQSNSFSDEPLTPSGRFFLQQDMNTIIHCVVGFKDPLDIPKSKHAIMASVMVQHPRFQSLLVRDKRGFEHWRKTHIDVDRHIVVVEDATSVENYLADLSVSSPLSEDKPLWEIHALVKQNCAVFRIHHALGDGVSLMSMLLASCRRSDDADALPTVVGRGSGEKIRRESVGGNWWDLLVGYVKMVFLSLAFAFELLMRALWVSDRKTAISGGAGVELWPRKLATARFLLDDMKEVKNAVAGGTINDVLFAVVSSGLSRYLDHRSPNALPEGLRISGLAMVNVRQQPGLQELSDLMKSNSGTRWGNKFGMILLPLYYHKGGDDPLAYLKRAKAMSDRKKLTLEAHFSHIIKDFVTSWFGPKVTCMINYRINCNTSFTISNVAGPREEITLAGNPITYLRANITSMPHALIMHMVSYAGRADMQILVAKDIIPDPEFLAKCFEDALFEMKEAALISNKT